MYSVCFLNSMSHSVNDYKEQKIELLNSNPTNIFNYLCNQKLEIKNTIYYYNNYKEIEKNDVNHFKVCSNNKDRKVIFLPIDTKCEAILNCAESHRDLKVIVSIDLLDKNIFTVDKYYEIKMKIKSNLIKKYCEVLSNISYGAHSSSQEIIVRKNSNLYFILKNKSSFLIQKCESIIDYITNVLNLYEFFKFNINFSISSKWDIKNYLFTTGGKYFVYNLNEREKIECFLISFKFNLYKTLINRVNSFHMTRTLYSNIIKKIEYIDSKELNNHLNKMKEFMIKKNNIKNYSLKEICNLNKEFNNAVQWLGYYKTYQNHHVINHILDTLDCFYSYEYNLNFKNKNKFEIVNDRDSFLTNIILSIIPLINEYILYKKSSKTQTFNYFENQKNNTLYLLVFLYLKEKTVQKEKFKKTYPFDETLIFKSKPTAIDDTQDILMDI